MWKVRLRATKSFIYGHTISDEAGTWAQSLLSSWQACSILLRKRVYIGGKIKDSSTLVPGSSTLFFFPYYVAVLGYVIQKGLGCDLAGRRCSHLRSNPWDLMLRYHSSSLFAQHRSVFLAFHRKANQGGGENMSCEVRKSRFMCECSQFPPFPRNPGTIFSFCLFVCFF